MSVTALTDMEFEDMERHWFEEGEKAGRKKAQELQEGLKEGTQWGERIGYEMALYSISAGYLKEQLEKTQKNQRKLKILLDLENMVMNFEVSLLEKIRLKWRQVAALFNLPSRVDNGMTF